MEKFTFSITMRDRDYNIISQGRMVVDGESADEAKADIMETWHRNWPDDKVHDIELHQIATIQRGIILT